MAENFKVVREHRRLETNINVPPVDDNLQIRTLISRNIPYDIRHRQIDRQTSRRQKPNIPSRPNSLKVDNFEMSRDLRREIDYSEHISDRLCKIKQLIRKPKSSRNNSQSDWSDYTSFTSSSAKHSDQIANPSCRHMHLQHFVWPKIHSVEEIKG